MPARQPPSVVVHSLAQAEAALAAAAAARRALRLRSPGYLGWELFHALAEAAGAAVPAARFAAVFDADGQAGYAADAIRRGARLVLFPARHPQRPALAALARAAGARLLPPARPALDLADHAAPQAAVAALLARRRLHGSGRSG